MQENSIDDAEVVITCKNYNLLGGLSYRLHNSEFEVYQIKALMGKGLGLAKEGTHLAFAAGTGIMPFVDFVAFMVRRGLGLIPSHSSDYMQIDD